MMMGSTIKINHLFVVTTECIY